MMGIVNGVATALALATFLGIFWWAFSAGRARANHEAAMLPFIVPDEHAGEHEQEGSHE